MKTSLDLQRDFIIIIVIKLIKLFTIAKAISVYNRCGLLLRQRSGV